MATNRTDTSTIRLKINGEEIKNSYNELNSAKKKLIKSLNGMEKGTREYEKTSKLLEKVADRTEKVRKENREVANAWKRQTAEFKKGLDSRINGISLYGTSIGDLRSQFTGVTLAMDGTTRASKLLKVALISTGVGALVIAFGSLVTFLATTQRGMDAVTTVTRPLSVIFQRLLGVVQDFGGFIFDKLAPALRWLKNVMKDIGLLDGEGFLSESLEQGRKLDELTKKIRDTEIELTKNRGRLNREFQEQKRIAADTSKDENERLEAAQRAREAFQELTKQENELTDLRIKKMMLEHSFNDTSKADEKELAQLIAQREDQLARQEKRLQSIDALENSASSARIANLEKEMKLREETREKGRRDTIESAKSLGIELEKEVTIGSQKLIKLEETITGKKLKESERRNAIARKEIEMQLALADSFGQVVANAIQSSQSFDDMAGNILNAIKQEIAGLIARGVAAAVSNTLLSGGPAGVFLAPVAGAAAAAIFQQMVPSFNTGGFTGFGDLGLGRNSGGNIRGVVEEGEYVINRNMLRDPYVANLTNYLEGLRISGGGNSATNQQPIQVSNTLDNSELLAAADKILQAAAVLQQARPPIYIGDRNAAKITETGQRVLAQAEEARSRGSLKG